MQSVEALVRSKKNTPIVSKEAPIEREQKVPKHNYKLNTIGATMITCRKNCFEQLIFELHRITVHLLSFARINFRL